VVGGRLTRKCRGIEFGRIRSSECNCVESTEANRTARFDGKTESFCSFRSQLERPAAKQRVSCSNSARKSNRVTWTKRHFSVGRDRGVIGDRDYKLFLTCAERTLSREENGGKASVAAAKRFRADVEESKPDQAADLLRSGTAFARLR